MSVVDLITREIGIDAGHRIPDHKSKCRNLHGHRYTVHASVTGALVSSGEEAGMVMDFGFLKDEMMQCIDARADHALILWHGDPILPCMVDRATFEDIMRTMPDTPEQNREGFFGKLWIINRVPTAENLAAIWFAMLAPRVADRTGGRAHLFQIKVWETPNCYAVHRHPALNARETI